MMPSAEMMRGACQILRTTSMSVRICAHVFTSRFSMAGHTSMGDEALGSSANSRVPRACTLAASWQHLASRSAYCTHSKPGPHRRSSQDSANSVEKKSPTRRPCARCPSGQRSSYRRWKAAAEQLLRPRAPRTHPAPWSCSTRPGARPGSSRSPRGSWPTGRSAGPHPRAPPAAAAPGRPSCRLSRSGSRWSSCSPALTHQTGPFTVLARVETVLVAAAAREAEGEAALPLGHEVELLHRVCAWIQEGRGRRCLPEQFPRSMGKPQKSRPNGGGRAKKRAAGFVRGDAENRQVNNNDNVLKNQLDTPAA